MAGKAKRRRFGWVRKLPSGRFQASYLDPAGVRRYAPTTYESRPEAVDWLTIQEAAMVRREWTDPDRGKVPSGLAVRGWGRGSCPCGGRDRSCSGPLGDRIASLVRRRTQAGR